jgi:type IV secretory pathway VirD2 relaxase
MDALERQLGQQLEWSAWSHRDTNHPHVHVVLKDPRRDVNDGEELAKLEAAIVRAAGQSYGEIRERQREWAKRQERERGLER